MLIHQTFRRQPSAFCGWADCRGSGFRRRRSRYRRKPLPAGWHSVPWPSRQGRSGSGSLQRGRHWGMESQNKILFCIPETQNNRGSLTTTKTNFFSLRKEKEERQSPNFYAWQVLCECGQLNLILLASVRLPKSLRARVTEGSPRRESLSFLGCSQGGLQSNLGIQALFKLRLWK